MAFAYYSRLNRRQQQVYRQSDTVRQLALPNAMELRPLVMQVALALKQQHKANAQRACQELVNGITAALRVPPVRIKLLSVRPSTEWEELHGFYEPAEGSGRSTVTVWMRTAQRRQVVAFRTFLRTLLHEICHHLDYELLRLEDSFHTEGFYSRENSLFKQLVVS
jgi:hypothetical protein